MTDGIWKCPKCGCHPNIDRDNCKCACGYKETMGEIKCL